MRNAERITRVLAELEALWRLYPDWRLGQLIVNVHPDGRDQDPFHVEDDRWLAAFQKWQRDYDELIGRTVP